MDTGDLTGRQFGPFQIQSLLGAGGMGQVFRARDLTLGREVAIKIISDVGHDPDRRIRFEREARMLASLNHPNVASIYSVETIESSPALVLELVDGPTLAERLASGPLPIDDAIAVARQLVDALDAAHEKGIVHRDLKPANIKLTPEGVVKVLDFGLAKATEDGPGPSPSASVSPTVTAGLTRIGTILGTVAYMSPEQARGGAAGRSADIWAFGCVVYETLTGRRAFAGATVSDTLAAVLTSEPDWTSLAVPPPVETLVRRCLEKDTKRRLRDISDARIWLEESQRRPVADPSSTRSRRTGLARLQHLIVPVVAVAAFAAGAAFVTFRRSTATEVARPTLRFEITPPPDAPFTTAISGGNLALSRDGSQLAYQAVVGDGYQLMVRRFDAVEATPVPGSELAQSPFFSPDGKRIGFVSGKILRTVAIDSGAQTTICPLSGLALARWSDDGTIAFTDGAGLFRVAETGGTPELVARPDPAKGEANFFGIDTLPGGGVLIGASAKAGSGNRPHVSALARGARELKVVLEGTSVAFFAGGVLVYPQVKGLTAVPFDVERLQTTGPPAVIEPGGTNFGSMGVARNGTIAYARRPDPNVSLFRVALLSPTGQPIKTIADDLMLPRHPRVSPDGRRLALAWGPGNFASVWIYDLTGGAQPVKLTQSPGSSEFPVWRHDGTQLAMLSRAAAWRMTAIPTDGSVLEPREMLQDEDDPVPQSWAPNGKTLLYQVTKIPNGTDIMEFDGASGKPRPWLQTRSNEREARFSPDGRWVAYVSDQTGRFEVWVRAYNQAGGPIGISSDGGHEPAWSRDGRTIFYLAGTKMMAAKFDGSGTRASAAPPRVVFEGGFLPYNAMRRRPYDVLPDGRIVVLQRVRPVVPESIVVVLNALPGLPNRTSH